MRSMPERYREAFDAKAIEQHAAIVARRSGQRVRMELWQRLSSGEAVLCVVADDQPGLLSLISASLVAHGIDIIAVKAYTRIRPDTRRAEAVDLVWVRRSASASGAHFLPDDLAPLNDSLSALATGSVTVESLLGKQPLSPSRGLPSVATRVAFDEDAEGSLARLSIEAADRPGLLLAISQALFRAGVQIVDSDVATRQGRVFDRFTVVERDGTALVPARRRAVQADVLAAIESHAGMTSKRPSAIPPKQRKSKRPSPTKIEK
jgi:[protein-PII] uridylyltransferase